MSCPRQQQYDQTTAILQEQIRLEAEELNRIRAAQRRCQDQYEFIVKETYRLDRETKDLEQYPKPLQGALLARAQQGLRDIRALQSTSGEYNALCVRNRQ